MIRGGSWIDTAPDVRAAYRDPGEPSYRNDYLGFRCAEFRQGVVSGARRRRVRSNPGDRDPTSAAARLREDDGLDA